MAGPQTKTIDGLAVTCAPLDGWDGWALLPDLAGVLGPLLSARAANADEVDLEQLLREASKALAGERLPELMVRLMRNTVIVAPGPSGPVKHEVRDRATFSLAFSGERFWLAPKVAAFAFEVTYGNFSAALAQFAAVATG